MSSSVEGGKDNQQEQLERAREHITGFARSVTLLQDDSEMKQRLDASIQDTFRKDVDDPTATCVLAVSGTQELQFHIQEKDEEGYQIPITPEWLIDGAQVDSYYPTLIFTGLDAEITRLELLPTAAEFPVTSARHIRNAAHNYTALGEVDENIRGVAQKRDVKLRRFDRLIQTEDTRLQQDRTIQLLRQENARREHLASLLQNVLNGEQPSDDALQALDYPSREIVIAAWEKQSAHTARSESVDGEIKEESAEVTRQALEEKCKDELDRLRQLTPLGGRNQADFIEMGDAEFRIDKTVEAYLRNNPTANIREAIAFLSDARELAMPGGKISLLGADVTNLLDKDIEALLSEDHLLINLTQTNSSLIYRAEHPELGTEELRASLNTRYEQVLHRYRVKLAKERSGRGIHNVPQDTPESASVADITLMESDTMPRTLAIHLVNRLVYPRRFKDDRESEEFVRDVNSLYGEGQGEVWLRIHEERLQEQKGETKEGLRRRAEVAEARLALVEEQGTATAELGEIMAQLQKIRLKPPVDLDDADISRLVHYTGQLESTVMRSVEETLASGRPLAPEERQKLISLLDNLSIDLGNWARDRLGVDDVEHTSAGSVNEPNS